MELLMELDPVKSSSYVIITINEMPKEVIPCFFLSLIPFFKDINNTLSVCRRWADLKIEIYRKVEQEWPFVRRSQILHKLVFSREWSVFTVLESNLIDAYMNEIPSMYSAKEFMSSWLKGKLKTSALLKEKYETEACEETNALIEKKVEARLWLNQLLNQERFPPQNKTEFFTEHFLENEEFEVAFAFSETIDKLMKNECSKTIQSFLIEKRGYKEALKLTIAYNNPESQLLSYQAFLELGAPVFHEFRRSDATKLSDLLNHPFLEACRLFKSLPLSSVHLLLVRTMISPVCREFKIVTHVSAEEEVAMMIRSFCNEHKCETHASEESVESMEIESPLLSHPLCNHPLIIELFSLIPDHYDFGDGNIINKPIVKIYFDYVDSFCPAMPDPHAEVLSEEQERLFIQTIDAIPHTGLKKAVLSSIMSSYEEETNDDLVKMKVFWPCLCRLEDHFCVNQGSATKALITLLIKNDSEDFIREINKTSTSLEKFPELVMALFEKNPGFLNEIQVSSYELLKVYQEVFKLFIGQNTMIRLIKDSIKNEYVKAQLKLSKA